MRPAPALDPIRAPRSHREPSVTHGSAFHDAATAWIPKARCASGQRTNAENSPKDVLDLLVVRPAAIEFGRNQIQK